jgi:hypothetical protein
MRIKIWHKLDQDTLGVSKCFIAPKSNQSSGGINLGLNSIFKYWLFKSSLANEKWDNVRR